MLPRSPPFSAKYQVSRSQSSTWDLEKQKMGEAELTAIFHGLDSAASSAGSLPLECLNVAHTDMGDTATIALTDFLKTASLPHLNTVAVMFNDIR
jgi:hypothetical protein